MKPLRDWRQAQDLPSFLVLFRAHYPTNINACGPTATTSAGMPVLAEGLAMDERESVVEQWLRRNAEVLARLQ
jgi:hypothetical protein